MKKKWIIFLIVLGALIDTFVSLLLGVTFVNESLYVSVVNPDGKTCTIVDFEEVPISNIIIPRWHHGKKVTRIENNAFFDNEMLQSVVIPNTVTYVGSSAFSGCSNLKRVKISKSVTSIQGHTFSYCKSLKTVQIPSSVTQIGNSAFFNCSNLKSVKIPASVTTIENAAFYGCKELVTLQMPDSVTYVGEAVFKNCPNLRYKVKDGLKYLGNLKNPYAYLVGATNEDLITANISKKCKIIAANAFYNNNKLKTINIPDSVKSVGRNAFAGCNNLQYNKNKGLLYLGNDNEPYIYLVTPENKGLTEYEIAEGCKFIGQNAFETCQNARSIVMPQSLLEIGDYAFARCSKLASIEIPDSVRTLGYNTFSACTSLTEVSIPNSVTEIPFALFAGCWSGISDPFPVFRYTVRWRESAHPPGYANRLFFDGRAVHSGRALYRIASAG